MGRGKTLIFDFDGTLADTFPLVVDVSYRLSPHTRRLPEKELADLRQLPLLTAMRRLGISHWYMPSLIVFVRRRLTPRMKEVDPYEGILPMLRELRKAGHDLFIVTSNYKENVDIFLKHHKVDHLFSGIETVFYASKRTKTRAIRRLIRHHQLQPTECYYVGNEALDTHAAQHVGIHSVAVTWGGFDINALKAARADALIDHPRELTAFIAKQAA
jgi:phosphoglycolate phosphatase